MTEYIFCGIFYDFEMFFDTISMDILLEECVNTDFPPVIAAFLIQQHDAHRVIQANVFSAEGLLIFRSIIAGCKSSVAVTRVYLRKTMMYLYNK